MKNELSSAVKNVKAAVDNETERRANKNLKVKPEKNELWNY